MRRLAFAILLVATVARADDEDPAETCRVTAVHAKLVGQTATFTVQYAVDVAGPAISDYAGTFELPSHGSLVHATMSVNGHRRLLEMRDATAAGEAFTAIKERAAGDARGWAVLLSKSGGTVQVGIAAPREALVTFDLEITAPTCFAKDVRYVELPERWRKAVDPGLRAQLRTTENVGDACASGENLGGPWIAFASPELERRPAGDQRVGANAGRLALGPDQNIVRTELDLAETLSEIPRDLATVFVVDGSRSMTAKQIEAQRAVIAAYLAKAPESRVQVIAYSRTARALLPAWMTAAQASARIDRELRALAPRNGSNVDLGIAGGADWLVRTSGTRRMIVIGDDVLPQRIEEIAPATLRRVLPEHTLVHAIVVRDDTGLARDDSAHFTPLANATDGMGVSAGLPDATTDVTMLLRPITLDQISVRAPGWAALSPTTAPGSCSSVESLAEGGSCTWWGHGDDTAGPVTIEGLLWGHRVVRTLQPDPARHREIARELSADAELAGLSEAEQARVHAIAFAVNPAWSMYAAWGGTDGYADMLNGSSSCTCGGSWSTSSHDFGRGFGWSSRQPPLDLTAQLAPAVASCKPGRAKLAVTVETTLQETVEVTVEAADAKLRTCVENAVWDVALMIPHAPYRAVTRVAFP